MKHLLIIATTLMTIVIIAYVATIPSETVTTPQPQEPQPITFEQLVEQRTLEIYERDHAEYMEASRLKALQELNEEAQEVRVILAELEVVLKKAIMILADRVEEAG